MGVHLLSSFPRKIKIEPVLGCDKKCAFCERAYMDQNRELIFMFRETLEKVCDEIAYHKNQVRQINIGVHGEPTLHPECLYFVSKLRSAAPYASLLFVTNGYTLRRDNDCAFLRKLIDEGVTNILLDAYDKETQEIFLREQNTLQMTVITDTKGDWNTEHKGTIVFNSHNSPTVSVDTRGSALPYSNGINIGVDYSGLPFYKSCKELHKYFTIRADGNVPICCIEGSESFYLGNVRISTIHEIWNSELANVVRYVLNNKGRKLIPPCYACNKISYRDGLFPYTGKQYTPKEIKHILIEGFRTNTLFLENLSYVDKEGTIQRYYTKD